jgi:hypothetical protein
MNIGYDKNQLDYSGLIHRADWTFPVDIKNKKICGCLSRLKTL